MLAYDPLDSAGADVVRLERACTAHVFRLGGNGSTSPGPIQSGYDGVSRIGKRQLTEAWYGAGVWTIDLSGPSSSTDSVREDARSTWGNTLGWNARSTRHGSRRPGYGCDRLKAARRLARVSLPG